MSLASVALDLPLQRAIEELREANSEVEARGIIGAALAKLGVTTFAFHFSLSSAPQLAPDSICALSSYDPLWLTQYQQNQLMAVDPVAKQALAGESPFAWAALSYRPRDDAAHVMEQARRFDIANGFSLPQTTPWGFACLSLCFGSEPTQHLDTKDVGALNLALPLLRREAIYLFLQLGLVRPKLTEQQRRVLKLATEGHSNVQIAKRRGVEKSTVDSQLRDIFRRLGVKNRTAAIGEACRIGELNIDHYLKKTPRTHR
jgi:DNA-binding CsgD family transcriptional regulator